MNTAPTARLAMATAIVALVSAACGPLAPPLAFDNPRATVTEGAIQNCKAIEWQIRAFKGTEDISAQLTFQPYAAQKVKDAPPTFQLSKAGTASITVSGTYETTRSITRYEYQFFCQANQKAEMLDIPVDQGRIPYVGLDYSGDRITTKVTYQ